jgi:hypothetical protein
MGCLDEWESGPLLILLTIGMSQIQARSGQQRGSITRQGSGAGKGSLGSRKRGATHDRNVVFPTCASPNMRIVTSGGSAIPNPSFSLK